MGNNQPKLDKNFFEEIKQTTSYRDFVIKMNQLISRNNVSWEFSFEQINYDELSLYEDLIKHFLIFCTDYIYEHTHKKISKDKESFRMVKAFLDILQKILVFLTIHRPKWLFENLWMRVNQDLMLEPVMDEGNNIKNAIVDTKDYIGSEDQFTVAIKLLSSLSELLFKNEFCVKYEIDDKVKLANTIMQQGWNKCSSKSSIVANRISTLEFILTFIMVDRKMSEMNGKKNSVVLSFFKHTKAFDILIKSLLKTGCDYQENGMLPYSAFFFKEKMENSLYLSSLCLNISQLLLNEESEASRNEYKNKETYIPLYLTKIYIKNHQFVIESSLRDVFEDELFMQATLESLSNNIISLYYSNKSVLPNSYKEVFLEESVFGREYLPATLSFEQKRINDYFDEQTEEHFQHHHSSPHCSRSHSQGTKQRHVLHDTQSPAQALLV